MGLVEYCAPYHGNASLPDVDETDTIPAGFTSMKVNGMICFTNGKENTGTTPWYTLEDPIWF